MTTCFSLSLVVMFAGFTHTSCTETIMHILLLVEKYHKLRMVLNTHTHTHVLNVFCLSDTD
jgi:hypothetical protein